MFHFSEIDILPYVYGVTFANSTDNTAIISTFNVENSSTAKVHRDH